MLGGSVIGLAMTLEDDERGGEEASCGEGEEDDGVTIGSLSGGWCGGGVVEALGAALSAEGWGCSHCD
jgi:hypothetical protein